MKFNIYCQDDSTFVLTIPNIAPLNVAAFKQEIAKKIGNCQVVQIMYNMKMLGDQELLKDIFKNKEESEPNIIIKTSNDEQNHIQQFQETQNNNQLIEQQKSKLIAQSLLLSLQSVANDMKEEYLTNLLDTQQGELMALTIKLQEELQKNIEITKEKAKLESDMVLLKDAIPKLKYKIAEQEQEILLIQYQNSKIKADQSKLESDHENAIKEYKQQIQDYISVVEFMESEIDQLRTTYEQEKMDYINVVSRLTMSQQKSKVRLSVKQTQAIEKIDQELNMSCQKLGHKNTQITWICFNKECKENKFLCLHCVEQHPGHLIHQKHEFYQSIKQNQGVLQWTQLKNELQQLTDHYLEVKLKLIESIENNSFIDNQLNEMLRRLQVYESQNIEDVDQQIDILMNGQQWIANYQGLYSNAKLNIQKLSYVPFDTCIHCEQMIFFEGLRVSCGHAYHSECLRSYSILLSQTQSRIHCKCGVKMQQRIFQNALLAKVFYNLIKNQLYELKLKTQGVQTCQNQKCGFFIINNLIGLNQNPYCPSCS